MQPRLPPTSAIVISPFFFAHCNALTTFGELPLTLMDGTLLRTMKLDGPSAARRTREHLERVEAAGGLAVLLWHPNAADERRFPGWWSSYLATLDWLADRAAWVTHGAEIAAWWREREKSLRLEG